MAQVIRNETTIFIDVDDTLILYPKDRDSKSHKKAHINFTDVYTGKKFKARRAEKHIKLIKDSHARGFFIVVWSGNGYVHAESIVKQLDIENYVDLIMTKPAKFLDDLQAHEVLGTRLYLEELN